MKPKELGKVRPTSILLFAKATKRFSSPLIISGLHIGPNVHGLSAGRLLLSAPKVKGTEHIVVSPVMKSPIDSTLVIKL